MATIRKPGRKPSITHQLSHMKIVINRCVGGFALSDFALKELGLESKHLDCDHFFASKNRTDPKIVACVEKLGQLANGPHAELKVVEIPDNVDWYICERDGVEHVAEDHRTWE